MHHGHLQSGVCTTNFLAVGQKNTQAYSAEVDNKLQIYITFYVCHSEDLRTKMPYSEKNM